MNKKTAQILWFKEVGKGDIGLVGGKGANLGEMVNAKIPVPDGFVVTANAYYDFLSTTSLKEKIMHELSGLDVDDSKKLQEASKKIKTAIMAANLPKDLAEQMIRLSGLVPHRDIEVKYTGLRPGEKLYEEIFHESEDLRGTNHPKLQLARSRQFEWDWLISVLDELGRAATSRDVPDLIKHLRAVVPEYNGLHISENNKKEDKPLTPLRVVGGGGSLH